MVSLLVQEVWAVKGVIERYLAREGETRIPYLLTGCALSVSDLGASLGRSDLDGSLIESKFGTSRRSSEFGAPGLSLAFSRTAVKLHKKVQL